ncbi:natterin-4-like isoform X2 [Hypomesus transpacificus]|uniref:natterin-4-like isoform X2 n=1 Tax=Hypomesus transpacificus TaxID=137520 RepID=UPI001F07DDD7|nr:natterin-4-like isoform X2 [Hypomesus transpacificus]
MKKQSMNLPALVICAFLLKSIVAEDDDGSPKLSNETVTQTVTKTVVTTVEATQPPLMMGRIESVSLVRLYTTANVSLKRVEWSGSLPQRAVNYICAPRTGCNMTTGFYSPSKGPFCFHTCDGKEDKSSEFDILVDELKSTVAEDDDGYPKLSIKPITTSSTKTGETTVEGKQAPWGRARLRSNSRVNNKDNMFLKWVRWSGSLPQWAVKVHIPGTGREDYICSFDMVSGYYNPSLGSFCYGSYLGRDKKYSEFDILVNEQNLELLEWKAFAPKYLKNGVPADKDSNNASRHSEENCEILTLQTGQSKTRIHNIEYHIDDLAMLSQQPTVFNQMRVENHNCRDIDQEVHLEGSTERQSSWETSISNSLTLSASIEVTVPFVSVSAGVEYSNSKTLTNGNSLTETVSHSLTVKVTVPPNHSCVVKMAGKTNKFDIPYKAQLSREFTDGRVHTIPVSGTYKGVQVAEMHAVAERCLPLPKAKPCP